MVRLRSAGSKHRKVQTKVKNRKKKRNSVSRGTETDFDQVEDTNASNLDDSFGIWMGGKTSTPEKKDSSPTSVWYSHRRIDTNDHSAHSIVFFEETFNSSKSGTNLDSAESPDLNGNVCKTSPMQQLYQLDSTLSPVDSVKDESGTLVFESSGKVFFRHREKEESSDVDGVILKGPCDIERVDTSRCYPVPGHSESINLTEENLSPENEQKSSVFVVEGKEDVTLKTTSVTSEYKYELKQDAAAASETEFSSVNVVRKIRREDKNTLPTTGLGQSEDELGHQDQYFGPEGKVPGIFRINKTNTTTSLAQFSPYAGTNQFTDLKEDINKENKSPLGQIPNKSRSRRCIALTGDDVMTNFDDAMNELKDKFENYYVSDLQSSIHANKRHEKSLQDKFGSIFEYPSNRKSPKQEGRNTALSDVTNNVDFVRAQYRAPAEIKIREPSAVTSRALLTQRKCVDIPDKHIYSNLPTMMFPCLTTKAQKCDVRDQPRELTYPDSCRTYTYDEIENYDNTGNLSAFVLHTPNSWQGFNDQKISEKDELSDTSTHNSTNEECEREKRSPREVDNSSYLVNQTTDAFLNRNLAQSLSETRGEDSKFSRESDFRQQEKPHRYNSARSTESSLLPQLKSHEDEGPEFQRFPSVNIPMSSQQKFSRKNEIIDENSHSLQCNEEEDVLYDSPVIDHRDIPYETRYSDGKMEQLNAKNKHSELNLGGSEPSSNHQPNSTNQSQDDNKKNARQIESLMKDQKTVRMKDNKTSKIPKLLQFYENQGTAKTHAAKSKPRSSGIPVTSTMSVSSRVNMFETNTEEYRGSEQGSAIEKRVSWLGSRNLESNSYKYKARRSLPVFQTGLPSCDELTKADKSYEGGLGGGLFNTVSQCKNGTQTTTKQILNRCHPKKSPNREAILLFEFAYKGTGQREVITFQRGEVVQVISNWIDGQVRVRKCSDMTEAIIPRKSLFFISGDASITKQAACFVNGPNYSDKTSNDSQEGKCKIKTIPVEEGNFLEPFLVVRPHISESVNEVTVLRGEVIIMKRQLVQEDIPEWSWVYVPRTQSFGFVPSSVARPLTFEPAPGCTTSRI